MFFEITADGRLILSAHAGGKDKQCEYFYDAAAGEYHMKPDFSDNGIPLAIEDGALVEGRKTM